MSRDASILEGFSVRWAALVLAALAGTAYAVSVTVLHIVRDAFGLDVSALEPHLAAIGLLGMALLLQGGGALIVLLLVVLVAAWRWHRRGRRASYDTAFAAMLLLLAMTSVYANVQGLRLQGLHERALAAAIERGDRKKVREVVFACDAFCGFDRDSAALVWLVQHADSEADFNAIGRILRRGGARNVPSAWLPDRRTAVQAAVDRYRDKPRVTSYVLGIDTQAFHFPVALATQEELDAALAYALRQQGPPELVDLLRRRGAQRQEAGSAP